MRLMNFRGSRIVASAVIAGCIGLAAGAAIASQPDMIGALHALEGAQGHLKRVTQNKGGHAAAARNLVAQAIAEVQEGIQVGHEHGE